jgi:hypothetical protein
VLIHILVVVLQVVIHKAATLHTFIKDIQHQALAELEHTFTVIEDQTVVQV